MTLAAPFVGSLGRVAQVGRRDILLPSPPMVGTFGIPGPYVYDAQSARKVPAVGRAIQLYGGLTKQMPMDAYRGSTLLPQPRMLARPDPDRAGSWFVQVNVEDYLLSGNAISLVTQRGADGWPLATTWLPAQWTYIVWDVQYGAENALTYYYLGQPLPFDDVVHVRRGADRMYPVRGVGVVEEYLGTLDRVAMEEEYERGALAGGAVPSVAVITPQATLDQATADSAKDAWLAKFSGPQREPVILPSGTQVVPLAWSPTDTQLSEARRMSLTDVANMFNLDSYWLGAAVQGMTYKTAAPQYQQILRTSLEGVLADFEDVWSDAWLVRGTQVRFRRSQLLREDLATSTSAAVALYGAGIVTQAEARVLVGLPAEQPAAALGTGADLAPAIASPDDPNASLPEGEAGGGTSDATST
jgi:HK97 family phage portal protein